MNPFKKLANTALLAALMASFITLPSCNRHNEKQTAAPVITPDQLLEAIGREASDSNVHDFSPAMLDTIEMYFDAVMPVVKNANAPVEEVLTTKSTCLIVMDALIAKGKNCKQDRLERIIEKATNVQFEFAVDDNEEQYCMNLANVFLPSSHEDAAPADFFDFYVFFSKATKRCDGILCLLPLMFSDKDTTPQFFAFLKKSATDEETEVLDVPVPEYNEEYGCWQVKIEAKEFDKIMEYGNIYFFATDNGEEGMERSTINLSRFKEQYAALQKL